MTVTSGRPSDLGRVLSSGLGNIRHLRVICETHFWHTDDNLGEIVNMLAKMDSLEILEFVGNSYPDLLNVSTLLGFMRSERCNLKFLRMNIVSPFPGQYRIQDQSFMVNKVLGTLYNCKSLIGVVFETSTQDRWVHELNAKIRSILTNRGDRIHVSNL